ncbi:hypothetical protein DPMN_050080 [Dreissena polymorpha]|uniref:Uncharacterized protein n=1 Tax=Dreissena polymorpha TaxID=45954 RepID=A0A9D4CFG2_DREPO|nr:hypothetical protein DPMN_050080 [Dreissena polymorpha]
MAHLQLLTKCVTLRQKIAQPHLRPCFSTDWKHFETQLSCHKQKLTYQGVGVVVIWEGTGDGLGMKTAPPPCGFNPARPRYGQSQPNSQSRSGTAVSSAGDMTPPART